MVTFKQMFMRFCSHSYTNSDPGPGLEGQITLGDCKFMWLQPFP